MPTHSQSFNLSSCDIILYSLTVLFLLYLLSKSQVNLKTETFFSFYPPLSTVYI